MPKMMMGLLMALYLAGCATGEEAVVDELLSDPAGSAPAQEPDAPAPQPSYERVGEITYVNRREAFVLIWISSSRDIAPGRTLRVMADENEVVVGELVAGSEAKGRYRVADIVEGAMHVEDRVFLELLPEEAKTPQVSSQRDDQRRAGQGRDSQPGFPRKR